MAETNTTSQKLRKIKVVFWYSGPLPGVCVSFVVGRGGAGPCFALFLPPPLLSVSDFFLPSAEVGGEGAERSLGGAAALHVPSGCSINVCALSEGVFGGWLEVLQSYKDFCTAQFPDTGDQKLLVMLAASSWC